jgi:hypothetical protein
MALEGRVVSSDGQPIQGASVRWLVLQEEDTEVLPGWLNPGWGVPARRGAETRTDQGGRFRFEGSPDQERPFGSVLVVTHVGHSPGGADLAAESNAWPVDLVVELQRTPAVEVRVVDALGNGVPDARVLHVTGPADGARFRRFLSQEALTDDGGIAFLSPLDGHQAFWAERGSQRSIPWQGHECPATITLRLGETFTLGGSVVLPDWSSWNPEYEGERRILIAGFAGNLWRPLVNLRDVGSGPWGPVVVPREGMERIRVRLEGSPVLPLVDDFPTPPPGSYRRVDLVAELGVDVQIAVQDEGGRPIPTATARAWWGLIEAPSGANRVEGAAGTDGRILLSSVRAGTVTYVVSAPGYSFFQSEVAAPASFPVTLVKGGGIRGRCLHGGAPVRDFQVLYREGGVVPIHTTKDFFDREDGRFEIDSLLPGEWWVLAASPTLPACQPVLVQVRAEEMAEVVLELPAPIRGGGQVIDHVTGEPIPLARVQVLAARVNGPSPRWRLPVPVAQDGTFDLDGFVVGPNHITVEADGYASTDVTATPTSADFLDWGEIRLQRPQPLRVTLLGLESLTSLQPSDLTLSGLDFEEQHFGTDGTVTVASVPPGEHRLFISYPDTSWSRLQIRLDAGQDWSLEYKVAGARGLELRVLDENGQALANPPSLLLAGQEPNELYVVRWRLPRADGSYRYEGLRGSRVQAFVMGEDDEYVTSRDIDLTADEQSAEIRLGDERFRLRVIDPEHAPVPGAWVSIRTTPGDDFVGVGSTDAEGWISLGGLPSGPLLLNVGHATAGTRFDVPIEASAKELELVLAASGSLELRLLDGDLPLAGVSTRIETAGGVRLADPRDTGSDGVVRHELLGAGHYRLGCRRADCWPTTVERVLEADEHASLTVQMRRLADLHLAFVNKDGLPVSGLDVTLRSIEFDAPVSSWITEGLVQSSGGLTTDRDGRVSVERLPRGAYAWSVTFGQRPLSGRVELAPEFQGAVTIFLP